MFRNPGGKADRVGSVFWLHGKSASPGQPAAGHRWAGVCWGRWGSLGGIGHTPVQLSFCSCPSALWLLGGHRVYITTSLHSCWRRFIRKPRHLLCGRRWSCSFRGTNSCSLPAAGSGTPAGPGKGAVGGFAPPGWQQWSHLLLLVPGDLPCPFTTPSLKLSILVLPAILLATEPWGLGASAVRGFSQSHLVKATQGGQWQGGGWDMSPEPSQECYEWKRGCPG